MKILTQQVAISTEKMLQLRESLGNGFYVLKP